MPNVEATLISLGGTVIELLAAIVIAVHVLQALWIILRHRDSDAARMAIARGVLAALGFSVAGTLLKTIALQSWPQIRLFAFVLLLRTLLKQVFLRESRLMERRSSAAAPTQAARTQAAKITSAWP